MTMMRWFGAGRPTRGRPAPRAWALLVLGVAGLVQSGCQSGACGPCSGLRGRLGELRERVFPGKAEAGCCGSEGTSVAPIEYGTPAVGAPAVGVPAVGAPAVVVPGAGAGAALPPPAEVAPQQLEPAEGFPSAKPIPPSDTSPSQGARSPTGKVNYEAYRPSGGSGHLRGREVARALSPSPASTSRSSRGAMPPEAVDPLDNLPPLELPKEMSRDAPRPTSVSEPAPAPDAASSKDAAKRLDDADDPSQPVPAPAEEIRSVAPGIRHFAAVEPKLAGGSLPTPTGLDWLAEKGYKTILDLRDPGEVQPLYASEVTSRGLRYIALPITLKTVDTKHLELFSGELSLSDARPLYFCDTDGDRAGLLWYLRRITVDKVDPQVASREARELGLDDASLWQAASTYLESLKPAKPAPARVPDAATPASVPPTSSLDPTIETLTAAMTGSMKMPEVAESIEGDPGSLRDTTAWRPIAALVLTGLGAPLAYWGRSGFPISGLARTRASLPAPGRRLKSLPGGSGE